MCWIFGGAWLVVIDNFKSSSERYSMEAYVLHHGFDESSSISVLVRLLLYLVKNIDKKESGGVCENPHSQSFNIFPPFEAARCG